MSSSDSSSSEPDGLQVELFHPDSDREPGDTNIQALGFDVHPIVFPISLVMIAVFVAITIALGDQAAAVYQTLFDTVNSTFGWLYILATNLFLITLVFFGVSKYGDIKIGGVEAETEFSTFSWLSMLFSAGMGIGLMFFGVAEPMWHFGSSASDFMVVPPVFGAEGGTAAAGVAALGQTIFHWGFHAWGIYGLVGLGLAFFSFNRGLPLTMRSIFWPLLGERIYGWPGHVIDLLTVFATLFGLATSLGFGAAQVSSGLSFVFGDILGVASISSGTMTQIAVIGAITAIATLSVAAGLEKGISRLSRVNVVLMSVLLAFVIIAGPTTYIFGALGDGLAAYLGNFLEMSFMTGTVGGGASLGGYTVSGWIGAWTVFYWAWWIAWSPFVGIFIARISKGRTIREFVFGVLVTPVLFSALWFATMGGSAIFLELQGGGGIAATLANEGQTMAMFTLLSELPLTVVLSVIATLLVMTFFVTSSDSGSLVIDHLTSGGKHDVPKTQRIFWAVAEGTVAAVLLLGGGLGALQTATITTGLPFAILLVLMCYTMYLGIDHEYEILIEEGFVSEREEVVADVSGPSSEGSDSDSSPTVSD
ncbi:BCCT family transporter [Haloarculaceae archaeon H-GB1-1]|nr:BCCT family transporter [Haloarculaceae archaeon H-GB1-1]